MSKKRSKIHPKYKTTYRVRNWSAYEGGLVRRGDLTIWFDDAAVAAWEPPPSGAPGRPRSYSSLAIETALALRLVAQRDAAITSIGRHGRRRWKKSAGYHLLARAENRSRGSSGSSARASVPGRWRLRRWRPGWGSEPPTALAKGSPPRLSPEGASSRML